MSNYKNSHIKNIKRGVWDIIQWQLGRYKDGNEHPEVPLGFEYPFPKIEVNPSLPKVTWINHSSFLIEIGGVTILTDPIFSERCSPIPFVGPKRNHRPGIEIVDLPYIDIILISHNHYDHLDAYSVSYLSKRHPKAFWLVPEGLQNWFNKRKVHRVFEKNWWESTVINVNDQLPDIKITAVPSQHYSGRGVFDRQKSLWVGWVVEVNLKYSRKKKFYFVGDTGYNAHTFKEIGEVFSFFDLAMIPIGTYVPQDFMKTVHIGPADSVRIHQEVNSSLSLGMHWKTFKLSSEDMALPPYELYLEMHRAGVSPETFLPINPGIAINW